MNVTLDLNPTEQIAIRKLAHAHNITVRATRFDNLWIGFTFSDVLPKSIIEALSADHPRLTITERYAYVSH